MKRVVRGMLIWIPVLVLVIWTIGPFLVSFSVSLKAPGEVYSDPSLIPNSPSLDAYREVLGRDGFQHTFINSALVGVGTVLLTLGLAVPAAYAFARFGFRGRHFLLLFMLIPRLVPTLGLMVPLYKMAVYLGALDSRLTLVVVYTGTLLPLAVWLLTGFFQKIPRELEEAAELDGASTWNRLRYIVLPLAWPSLITIGVLAFREAWQEFQLVLVLTTSPEARTLPYELYLMGIDRGIANHPAEAAFALMTVLPFILIYLYLEKYVVRGITTGSGK